MKTAIAAILAIGLLTGTASASSNPFTSIADAAPRSATFADINASAPRSAFDALADAAPRSVFGDLQDAAPRSDGVYDTLETAAP